MNIKIYTLGTLFAMSAILTSCGGSTDGGNPPSTFDNTGIFLDSAVEGLYYSATPSGRTGVTDSLGQFNYITGDTITFTVGGTNSAVVLGEAVGTSTILVEDIADGTSGTKTAKIAILLQSLDDDNDADNGINVSSINFDATQSATTKAILDSELESGTHTFTLANIQNFKGTTTGVVLVTKASATAHIAETKKNKGDATVKNSRAVFAITILNGENDTLQTGSVSDKRVSMKVKSEHLTPTAITSASIDSSIEDVTLTSTQTHTSAYVASQIYVEFINKSVNNPESTRFGLLSRLRHSSGFNENVIKNQIYIECDSTVSTSCASDIALSRWIKNDNEITSSAGSATAYATRVPRNLSISKGGGNGSPHTFSFNNAILTEDDLGLSLDDNDEYVIDKVSLRTRARYAGTNTFVISTFDNLKLNGQLKDDFNDGIDATVFTNPTTTYNYR